MRKTGLVMMVLGWLLIGGLIWWVMAGREEAAENPNAVLANIDSAEEVVLLRNRGGHYVAPGFINGVEVTFMVDTGATDVAMPARVAERVGVRAGLAVQTQTANGTAIAYKTRLERVSLGGLEAANVAGVIVPGMQGEAVLLGMSYLSRFAIRMEAGEMHLRQR